VLLDSAPVPTVPIRSRGSGLIASQSVSPVSLVDS
jgi:hypothetical protein